MTVDDANSLSAIAYQYEYRGAKYYLVPISIDEPMPNQGVPAACPVALERGAERPESLNDVLKVENGSAVTIACRQCEGLWLKAHGRVAHISGETLSRYDDLVRPNLNYQLVQHINPPKQGS